MVLDIAPGEKVRSSDIDSIIDGVAHNGTLNGMSVTQSSVPAMTVDVGTGSYIANGARVGKAASTTGVVIAAADPSNARIDIIVGDSSGTITAVTGTPASSPNPPQVPANKVRFAFVNVAAATTTIVNANIQDARIFVPEPIFFNTKSHYRYQLQNFAADDSFFTFTGTSGGVQTFNISGEKLRQKLRLETSAVGSKLDFKSAIFATTPSKNLKSAFFVRPRESSTTGVATVRIGHATDIWLNTPAQYAVFEINMTGNTDTSLFCRTRDGTTIESTSVSPIPVSFSVYSIFSIEETASAVHFFINGTLVASHRTNIPASGTSLRPIFQIDHTAVADGFNSAMEEFYVQSDA